MSFSSQALDEVRQEVLGHQSDANVRRDSEVESGEADPQVSEALILDCLRHGVENVFVGEGSIRVLLHLLNLGLGVIKGQAAEGREEARNQTGAGVTS